MSKIEKAKNHNGETIFPVTVADAVLMGNGQTLKGKLSELGSELNLINLLFDEAEYNIGYITTGNIGSVVSLLAPNGNTSWKSIIVNANVGERFFIKGKGGADARLWAFLDANNVVLSSSKLSYTSKGEYIEAPQNAALVVVNFSNVETEKFYKVTRFDGDIKTMSLAGGYSQKPLKGYVNTNLEIGDTIELNITSNLDNFIHYVIDVDEGQEVVITGKGGGTGLLWAFIDSDNKLISKSGSSVELYGESIEVPTNASKVICNINNSSLYPNVFVRKKDIEITNIKERIKDSEEKLKGVEENFGEIDWLIGYITTGDIGTKVTSLLSNGQNSFKSAVIKTKEGESFFIKGKGGGGARLWAFLNNDNVVISSSEKSYTSTGENIDAPQGAVHLVVNFSNEKVETLYKITRFDNEIGSIKEEISDILTDILVTELEPAGNGYILTNVGEGNYVDLIPDSHGESWRYYISNVKWGQILRLEECHGGGNSRLWAFLDEESNLISISEQNAWVYGKIDIEVPHNAKKVIINNAISMAPNAKFTIFTDKTLDIRLYDLEKNLKFVEPKTINILIFGNSYSYRSIAQGEGNILNLARSIGADLFIEVIGNGGASFESNYNKHLREEKNSYRWEGDINTGVKDKAPEPLTFKEALQYKEWDYIIFHQASKYSGNIDSFTPYLEELIDVAKTYCGNENVKMGLMQTWAYADITLEETSEPMFPTTNWTDPVFSTQDDMYTAICNTYKQALDEYKDISFLIPAGTAIQNARAAGLGESYNDFGANNNDGIHINSEGTLITSLVVFNKVFGDKYNVKLSEVRNNYSALFNDEEFDLAIESARMAIKFPFKAMPIPL